MKTRCWVYTILVLMMCSYTLHAEPHAVLTTAAQDTTRTTYAMDFLISRRPIRYAVSESVTPEQEQSFTDSIKKWPQETARIIRESKRRSEFQDVLPIFQTKISLVRVDNAEKADVFLDIGAHVNCNDSVACFREKGLLPYSQVLLTDQVTYPEATMLHEVGHFYGLGDQYDGGRLNNHDEYSSNVNREEKAIMQGGRATNGQITCDDADGMINLLDLRRSKRNKGRFTWRANKGWASLCASSDNVYQQARTVTRTGDAYFTNGDSGSTLISLEYKDGHLVRKIRASINSLLQIFALAPEDEVIRDPATHLVTQTQTRLRGLVIFPQSPQWQSDEVTWKRQFTYQPVGSGEKRVLVHVDEWLNETKMGEREMTITVWGDLLSDADLVLSPSCLWSQNATHSVEFVLQNRKIVKFTVKGNHSSFVLTGTPDEVRYSEDGGKTFTQHALPITDVHLPPMLTLYYDSYTTHAAALMSFYKNFYEQLFRPSEEQITNEIKSRLEGGK